MIVNLDLEDEVLEKADEIAKAEGRSRKKQLELMLTKIVMEWKQ